MYPLRRRHKLTILVVCKCRQCCSSRHSAKVCKVIPNKSDAKGGERGTIERLSCFSNQESHTCIVCDVDVGVQSV